MDFKNELILDESEGNMQSDNSMIGERMKELRLANGLTQDEFSQIFHVSRSTVSCWERGDVSISVEALLQICNTFHIDMDYFFPNAKTKPKGETLKNDSTDDFTEQRKAAGKQGGEKYKSNGRIRETVKLLCIMLLLVVTVCVLVTVVELTVPVATNGATEVCVSVCWNEDYRIVPYCAIGAVLCVLVFELAKLIRKMIKK